ncbi:hypothetical protein [Streptomyces kanamyceticus]|uniref:LPXTG cell wall anchor domain-containing protein n=1 Tax=Streptomyces kanamyceticus TaxID=1967 RepID=A0A5J6G7T4_STRKN|nr:hypothetical protein [Streptomyces kanamyceticus]QEU91840.1 hypothetical protein CP970_13935 [Streptomyces kanamyceticus]
MSTHRRHTLLRTAAVSALAGGALLIPVAGAFADSPSAEPTASPTASQSPDKTDKPSDKRGPVFEVTLGNGAKAKVQNRGGAYVATISVDGKQIATLSSTHSTVTQGGVRYELYSSNGHIGITYLKGKDGKDGKDGKHDQKVTPRGGVKAGAEGVHSASDPAFLVAGGGMAAAGAAGLGFAMLRRGRTDS